MCVVDAAAKEAAVARFLRAHPRGEQADRDHPALLGCADVAWSRIPGCPAGIPALFGGLLDEEAGPEALRVLGNVLMTGVLHVGAAMPAAVPFLIRLASAADITVPVRSGLVDLLLIAAELSQPVDPGNAHQLLLLGDDRDHPERARCRAAFAAHASALRALLDDETLPELGPDDRACLLRAVEPSRGRSA